MTVTISKKQIRQHLEISPQTFVKWLKPFYPELFEMNYKPTQNYFTPAQAKFICLKLGIDIKEIQQCNNAAI
jgi:hypothetical protein